MEERAPQLPISYLVPLKAAAADHDLVRYLGELAAVVDDVLLVDGSAPDVFAEHARALDGSVLHLPPELDVPNGKVANVLTGLAHARHDLVVTADDDVRWTEAGLRAAIVAMDDADVGRPQNHFDPAPWHARWDTGRILLNRSLGGDWPGTMLVRRAKLPDGYAADCLFENLELERTVRANGGRARVLHDVFVGRRPPSTGKFLEQRVRQAYDELARPWRFVIQLALLPVLLVGRGPVAWRLAVLGIGVAELGRRRDGGTRIWPPTAALWAPAWIAERSVTAWLALLAYRRGGVRFGGTRFRTAAHRHRRGAGRTA